MKKVHYLTKAEEQSIKSDIPWSRIDRRIRELVLRFNKVDGVATVQSCEGHVRPINDQSFHVSSANVCLKVNQERYKEILDLAPQVGFEDVSLRYFKDGSFWICLEWEPDSYASAFDLTTHLLGEEIE